MGKGLKVERKIVPVCATFKPLAEIVLVGCRQAAIALLAGKLDDGARAQTTVEVIVKQDFGRLLDDRAT